MEGGEKGIVFCFWAPFKILDPFQNDDQFWRKVRIFSAQSTHGKNEEETVRREGGGRVMVQAGGAAAVASVCFASAAVALGCGEVVLLSLELGSSCLCCLGHNSGIVWIMIDVVVLVLSRFRFSLVLV